MSKKIPNSVLKSLQEKYEASCNAYLCELLNFWELSHNYGWWVSNEVGGVYCYCDSTFINMEDIVFCVKNSVTKEQYDEWVEYCLWAHNFNQTVPNLKSWLNGCPRASKEEQERLNNLRMEFEKEMDDVRKRIKTNPF